MINNDDANEKTKSSNNHFHQCCLAARFHDYEIQTQVDYYVIFNKNLTIIDTQCVSNKRVFKFTERVQIIRTKIVKIKKMKIHEKSIEFLIFLNFETTHFEQKNALFVTNTFYLNQIASIHLLMLSILKISAFRIKIHLKCTSLQSSKSFTTFLMCFSLSLSQLLRLSLTQRINDCHEMYCLRIIIRQQ
jgi:hypothetical protein